jgi:hypothetical protein
VSRGYSIWVVQNEQQDPVAAFTVKHEMITWLGQQKSIVNWMATRLPDNPDGYRGDLYRRVPAEDFI